MTNKKTSLPLEHAFQKFSELVASLSDEQFLTPMNGWTPRDVIAHLIGWNILMIESSLSILAGNPPIYYGDAPNDYSHINARFTEKYSSQSKQELLSELCLSMRKFIEFVSSLPDKELTNNHGVMHYSGAPATISKIINSLAGDYQSHTHQIKNWFKKV